MPIGIGEDHEELRRTVRRWLETRCPPEVPRALLDAETETMPPFWDELASQGWLGIHVAEEHGGQGFGMLELAVVVEEMARAADARTGGAHHARRRRRGGRGRRGPAQGAAGLPWSTARCPSAVALPGAGTLVGTRAADGSLA